MTESRPGPPLARLVVACDESLDQTLAMTKLVGEKVRAKSTRAIGELQNSSSNRFVLLS